MQIRPTPCYLKRGYCAPTTHYLFLFLCQVRATALPKNCPPTILSYRLQARGGPPNYTWVYSLLDLDSNLSSSAGSGECSLPSVRTLRGRRLCPPSATSTGNNPPTSPPSASASLTVSTETTPPIAMPHVSLRMHAFSSHPQRQAKIAT